MQLTDILNNRQTAEPGRKQQQLQEWAKAALLLALGVYFVYVIVSGNLANYINARFAWLSYVAAAMFLLLGAFGVYELLRREKPKVELEQFSTDLLGTPKTLQKKARELQQERRTVSWKALGVVAIPLVLGTLIPSRPLGSAAVGGSISLSAVSAANAQPFTTDPLTWNVLDWLRTFNNSGDASSFNGKKADLIGFVYREAAFSDKQFMLARFTISCCVADASAIGVPVEWDAAKDYPADTWVRIQGTWEVGPFRGDTVPILHPVSIDKVDQPDHPYLYP
ncbi:MAG: TIGR03943 family protein [Chloroflexota bacterium]